MGKRYDPGLRVNYQLGITSQKILGQSEYSLQVLLIIRYNHPVIHVSDVSLHTKIIFHIVIEWIKIHTGIQLAWQGSNPKAGFQTIGIDQSVAKPQYIRILDRPSLSARSLAFCSLLAASAAAWASEASICFWVSRRSRKAWAIACWFFI